MFFFNPVKKERRWSEVYISDGDHGYEVSGFHEDVEFCFWLFFFFAWLSPPSVSDINGRDRIW